MQDIDGIARYWESELALAGSRETRVPTIASPIGRTWIWSDLHLGDRGPLEAFAAVPVGAVNVHGHLHDGTEPTRRQVNVAVERWYYEPVPMATVAARALGRRK